MAEPKGFLLAMMEPPPAIEEEFNDWYDTEHIPERMRVPGFECARRFVCIAGWPRYLAVYDLASPNVLRHEQYLAVSGASRGPWTTRLGRKHLGHYRTSGTQVYPGNAMTGTACRTILVRFRSSDGALEPSIVDGLRSNFEHLPEVTKIRVLRSTRPGQSDHIGLVEAIAPLSNVDLKLTAFGVAARHIDIVNVYAAYFQSTFA